MNALRNKVNLIGRLGADPELVTFETGKILTRFTLATKEDFKDKSGEWQNNTQWHNINAWGKTAERVKKALSKGNEIMLEGRLINQSYETKAGEKRYSTIIEVSDFLLLSQKTEKEVVQADKTNK
jgi:single-strand DNA-binding protein